MVAEQLALVPIDNEDFSRFYMNKDIAAGMIWGVTEQLELTQLELCLKDVAGSKSYMKEGWDQMWRLDAVDINQGIKKMLNALTMVPNLKTDCTNATSDIAILDDWLDIFFRPMVLYGTVMTNLRSDAFNAEAIIAVD
jgi:hypothetical protein